MDFTALRTQVMALLQGEGRGAYRALKLQFQLDDDTLEALKDDLIYAKRLAVDEEGRVLVWTGGDTQRTDNRLSNASSCYAGHLFCSRRSLTSRPSSARSRTPPTDRDVL
jgi:hypothetical protein